MILKTINLLSGANKIVMVLSAFIFGVVGLGLIILGIYMRIKDIKFRKNGIPVKLTVKECKKGFFVDENNNDVPRYHTIFDFEYNGIKKEETIETHKKFKVGSRKEGIYLPGEKRNNLSVDGEGFYLSKGGDLFLVIFGILILFLAINEIFDFSFRSNFIIIVIFSIVILWLVCVYSTIYSKNKNIKNKQDTVNRIYYENVNNNEYSTVDENLIRFIPNLKIEDIEKKYNKKNSFSLSFPLILFGILGIIITFSGIETISYALKVKFTYPTITGKIEEIYKYTDSNNEYFELTGIVYKYNIDGVDYKLNRKSGIFYSLIPHKVGDKKEIYYEKGNPESAFLNSDLSFMFIPLVFGVMLLYVVVNSYIDSRKKRKLYETYILKRGE